MLSTVNSQTEKPCHADSREALILEHLTQVELIAKRIHKGVPSSVSLEDLISSGIVGLIAAVDNYKPSQRVKLKTYAEYKIRGAILDGLRILDWAPRRHRKRARTIETAVSELEQEHGRVPTQDEVASRLGLTLATYQEWCSCRPSLKVGSLEGAEERGTDPSRLLSDSEERWPSAVFESSELERITSDLIEQMPPAERKVLTLYFFGGMNLREIAEFAGLHESRISQLKAQALGRLRKRMQEVWPIDRSFRRPLAKRQR